LADTHTQSKYNNEKKKNAICRSYISFFFFTVTSVISDYSTQKRKIQPDLASANFIGLFASISGLLPSFFFLAFFFVFLLFYLLCLPFFFSLLSIFIGMDAKTTKKKKQKQNKKTKKRQVADYTK